MKIAIIFYVIALLAYTIMAGGEPGNQVSIKCISQDSIANGYYMEPVRIYNPFSGVCYIEFNLPEPSIVSLFITDSLENDTSWYCRKESMTPGLYRAHCDLIIEIRKRQSGGQVYAHLYVISTYGKDTGFPINCTFEAVRRM